MQTTWQVVNMAVVAMIKTIEIFFTRLGLGHPAVEVVWAGHRVLC